MSEFEEAFLAPLRVALNMTALPFNIAGNDEYFYQAGAYESFYHYAGMSCAAPAEGSMDGYMYARRARRFSPSHCH